eukprot:270302-Hanusia_phi.AAC.4
MTSYTRAWIHFEEVKSQPEHVATKKGAKRKERERTVRKECRIGAAQRKGKEGRNRRTDQGDEEEIPSQEKR